MRREKANVSDLAKSLHVDKRELSAVLAATSELPIEIKDHT